MTKITIPKCRNPFVVIMNGIRYEYESGKEVEVPDEVAAIIQFHVDSKPKALPIIGGSGPCGLPHVYFSDGFDRLPTDAPDGSLAVVEDSDSIVGTWLFNEEIPREGMPTHGDRYGSYYSYRVQCFSADDDNFQNYILLANFEEHGVTEGLWFCLKADLDGSYNILYDTTDFDGNDYGWQGEGERELTIIRCDDEIIANWIKSNAIRISGGHTLYARENGEWVNQGAVDFTDLVSS